MHTEGAGPTCAGFAAENLGSEVYALLAGADRQTTADHTRRVVNEARRVAGLFGVDADRVMTAAWLHDISAIHSPGDYAALVRERGLTVLAEEQMYPAILHQKLSAAMALERFHVKDSGVLTAIGCHTTLRADAGDLDLVLYVADKLAWDQADAAPYEAEMRAALATSLHRAALVHLRWMHDRGQSLPVVHPWLREAYQWLAGSPW